MQLNGTKEAMLYEACEAEEAHDVTVLADALLNWRFCAS
jgi:hypothetical protein